MTVALRSIWIKNFEKEHTKSRKTAISQLQSIMRSYNTKGTLSKGRN